jgi:hypothetical protein
VSTENGFFWRPETPEEVVPGRLITTDDGVTKAELMGPITPAMKVQSHNPDTGETTMVPADDPTDLVIHGVVAGRPNAVSLIDCWTPSRTTTRTRAGAIEVQTIQAGRLMRGDLISGSDARFTGVRLRVAGIDTWAGLPEARVERREDGRVELHLDPLDVDSVITSSGAALTLSVERVTQRRVGGVTTVRRAVWVQLTNLGERSYRQIDAEYATPIVGYLSFALGTSAPLASLQVLHGEKWITVTHTGMTAETDESPSGGDVLLPFWVAGLDVLSAFLDVYRQVGPAIPITRDALSNERNAILDTQVLELTTVAEGLHRDLYGPQERMSKEDAARVRGLILEALKDEPDPRYKDIGSGTVLNFLQEPNYKSRLRRLTDDVAEAMPNLCGDQKKWIERVNDARNSYAHRKGGFIDESMIDEMYAISQSLKWLFWGVILLKSGVPAPTLKERIERHRRYHYFLQQARRTVPTIYDK